MSARGLEEAERAARRAAREAVALFPLPDRGVIEVAGGDRIPWLDGMISGDVRALAAAGPGAGCPALLLTPQGRLVADLHVLLREEVLWLDLAGEAVAPVLARLEHYVIADDVTLRDRSPDLGRIALEGPAALALLREAAGAAGLDPPPGGFAALQVAGADAVAAAFSLTGGPGIQLFVSREALASVTATLEKVGKPLGLVGGGSAALECLRVEAGIPRLGRELDESVLPAEARLDAAVSTTKGCYTGQEVVARMRTRGRLSHQLVGLRFEAGAGPPGEKTRLEHEGRPAGEVTSVVLSPELGAIGLGFVKAELARPGLALLASGDAAKPLPAVVAELPFPRG